MISFKHIREINEQNGFGWHQWCTIASPYTIYSNRQGKLPYTTFATQTILFIIYWNMYTRKRFHAILMGVVKQYTVFY